MREAISISIRAERPYVRVLKRIAEAESRTVAELVREAVDARYGDKIRELEPLVAESDRKTAQLIGEANDVAV